MNTTDGTPTTPDPTSDPMGALVAAPTHEAALALADAMPLPVLRQLADLLYLDVPAKPRRHALAERIVHEIRPLCRYSLACENTATTTIDCGPVGPVAACQRCADLYGRLS